MTVDTTIPLWGLVTLVISILTMIYSFLATRRKDIEERFKQGSTRMADQIRRIEAIEATIRTMPGKDDLHAVQLELARMGGSLDKIEAVIGGNSQIMQRLEAIVSRHEQHLLDGIR